MPTNHIYVPDCACALPIPKLFAFKSNSVRAVTKWAPLSRGSAGSARLQRYNPPVPTVSARRHRGSETRLMCTMYEALFKKRRTTTTTNKAG